MTMQTNEPATTARATKETRRPRRIITPPVDVYENADELLLVADVPGVTPDGLTLKVERETLTLEATRGDSYLYERSFRLPHGIDTNAIEATLKNGVARIRLPKSEKLKPRTIPVRTG